MHRQSRPSVSASRAITLSLLGLLLGAAPLLAQAKPDTLAPYRNRLLGVFDLVSGDPVEGAQVMDVLNKTSSLTTRTGTVGLFFLPDGGGVIRITKIGYEPQSLTVGISPTEVSPITVMLKKVNELAPVIATAEAPKYKTPALRDFEERRQSGFGRFITEPELRKDDDRRLGDVLRKLPGLEVVPVGTAEYVTTSRSAGSTGAAAASRNRPPPRCRSTIYVDGINLGAQEVKQLPTGDQLAGIEWYASAAETPPQYNATGNACGVLLLWTRER